MKEKMDKEHNISYQTFYLNRTTKQYEKQVKVGIDWEFFFIQRMPCKYAYLFINKFKKKNNFLSRQKICIIHWELNLSFG
jgi:transposase